MGIVTKRIVSVIGVSRLKKKAATASLEADDGLGVMRWLIGAGKAKKSNEVYDNMRGVSGLHFIVFRVECLDRYRWRFCQGIDVCDFELNETSSPDSLRQDDLHHAVIWLHGAESVRDGKEGDSHTTTVPNPTESQGNANEGFLDGQTAQENSEYVDVVITPEH